MTSRSVIIAALLAVLSTASAGWAQDLLREYSWQETSDQGISPQQLRPSTAPGPNDNSSIALQSALVREGLSVVGRDIFPPRFVRMPPAGDAVFEQSDYWNNVRNASKNKTFRFSRMPIPVYIDAAGQPELMQSCLSALYLWEARSHELVRFVQVPTDEQARIQVRLQHHGFNPAGTPKGAVTHLDWRLKSAYPSQNSAASQDDSPFFVPPQVIDINLDVTLDRDVDMRPLLLRNVLAHELGHALGLLGHSPVQSDLLYKDTDEYSRLSERDLNTLNKLYQQKTDIPL